MFCGVREKVASQVEQNTVYGIYICPCGSIQSLADAAQAQNYIKPIVNDGDVIDIKDGRHPSVEKMTSDAFICK